MNKTDISASAYEAITFYIRNKTCNILNIVIRRQM